MGSAGELKAALATAFKVEAQCHSQLEADQAIAIATGYWIELHRLSRFHIITVDLTLVAHWAHSLGPSMISPKSLGVLKPFTLDTFNEPNTLVIYTSDDYTESWVHEWCIARAQGAQSRILNVDRSKNPEPDLATLKFPKLGKP